MSRRGIFRVGVVVVALVWVSGRGFTDFSPFAYEVVSSNGPFGPSPYDDPNALLGMPTDTVGFSMIYPAFGPWAGDPYITTLNSGSQITVRFDHHVEDDPLNPYGLDFIVYGNPFFGCAEGSVDPNANMENYHIAGGGIWREPVTVSVSQDGEDWHTYSSGPYGDDYYPMNAYAWDRDNDCWGGQLDWEWPVDPSLGASDFAGLSVPDAIDLYGGSAGGTGFDLAETGWDWIQYVRVEGTGGEIDGFSDVRPTPEPGTLSLLGLGLAAALLRRRLGMRPHAS